MARAMWTRARVPLSVKRLAAALSVLLLAACRVEDAAYTTPSASIGAPQSGNASTASISASFSRRELQALYAMLSSAAFQQRLSDYTCGDPVPHFEFALSIFEPAKYQERHLRISTNQDLDPAGRSRCLIFGLDHEIGVALAAIDKAPLIDEGYHDPLTGKRLPPPDRFVSRKPACDCAKRDGKEEWVLWPDPAATATSAPGT
jgi:hypothetical protein